MLRFALRGDDAVGTNAGVLVDDGVLDARVSSHPDSWNAIPVTGGLRRFRLVVIRTQQDRTVHAAPRSDETANADEALTDARAIDNASVRDDGLVDGGPVNLGSGQESRPGVNRSLHLKEVELWHCRGHVEIGLEESADGADVLPVTLVNKGVNPVSPDGSRDDVFPEVGHLVLEQLYERLPVEEINSHRRKVVVAARLNLLLGELLGRELE